MSESFHGIPTSIVREAQKQPSTESASVPAAPNPWRKTFEAHNKARAAAGERLRAVIQRIVDQHVGTTQLRAREVRRAIRVQGVDPLPSLRCVQWHLTAIRKRIDEDS